MNSNNREDYADRIVNVSLATPYCEFAFNEKKIHCDDGLLLKGGFTASSFIKRKLGADAINGHKLSLLIFLNIIVIIVVLYLASIPLKYFTPLPPQVVKDNQCSLQLGIYI